MSNTKPRDTFIDACLDGRALLDDIDSWVKHWHTADDSDLPGSLQDHLGMTDDEYSLWVEKPESLRLAVAAHRYDTPVLALVTSQRDYALAARSAFPEDTQVIVDWLRKTGRIALDAE